jgi:ATP/maltotriose-dependent transcriptional regulator MalT/DNA-binding SARP family transcriptional activator
LVATLVNEIHETIPEYFVVILDDFHLVGGSRPVETFFDLLLRYLPENCHIILATRTMPKLPLLRLAAYRQVVGLSSDDLRFTGEEIQGLLQQEYNLYLPNAAAEELARESEGWITGIILTTQTFWRGMLESLARARGTREQVFEYLATEVFAQQPEEVQRFLRASSILRQMHPSLCDELLEIHNSSELIEWIEDRNLFITRVEDRETWYKYHHLFQEFLQTRLRQENELEFTELHLRAAQLFEARGEMDEAIHHYFQIEAYEEARRLISETADAMFDAGRVETLAQWIDALPSEVLSAAPDLLVTRARVHTMAGELYQARQRLEEADSQFAAARDQAGRARVLVQQGTVDWLEGKYQSAIDRCHRALELLDPQDRALIAAARRNLGISLWAIGMPDQAQAELEKALELYEVLGDAFHIANVHQELGNCLVTLGNLAGSSLHYQRALVLWKRIGNAAALANVLNSMAGNLYHRGEYEQALELFEEALDKAQEAASWRFQGYILAGMGDVHRDLGDYDTCRELYGEALELATRTRDGLLTVYALDALGNTFRLRGDHATAKGLLEEACEEAARHQSGYELGLCETSLGILLCETGDPQGALEHLRQAQAHLERANARLELAKVHFHMAQALHLAKRWKEALGELQTALDMSYQLGVDQFMVIHGQRTLPLLKYAERRLGDQRLASLLQRIEEFKRTLAERPGALEKEQREEPLSPTLEIYAFGKGTVYRDSVLVTPGEWGAAQARELFFYLLSNPHASKEQIGAVFWPDLSQARMTSVFHATKYRLRRAVGEDCILYQEGQGYYFNRQLNYWFDVEQFERLLDEAEKHEPGSEAAERCYREAVALYRGEYLEDVYSDWAILRREALQRRYLEAVIKLAESHIARQEYEEAIQLYHQVLSKDNLREDVHRRLMECYVRMGERVKALQHYQRLLQLLAKEVGAPPAPETVALYERLLNNS